MYVVVGLGNKGEEYRDNRHNVGFLVLDNFCTKHWQRSKNSLIEYCWQTPQLNLVKPQTFMNHSGDAVVYILGKEKLTSENLIVIHDDLDLPLGSWKVQVGKGPKDHGGINDIEQKIGSKNFTRIRVGVDRRNPEDKIPGEEYVLQNFTKDERKILDEVINQVCKKLATL